MGDGDFIHAAVNVDVVDPATFSAIGRAWLEGAVTTLVPEMWERVTSGTKNVAAGITLTPHENGPIGSSRFSPERWATALDTLVSFPETVAFMVQERAAEMNSPHVRAAVNWSAERRMTLTAQCRVHALDSERSVRFLVDVLRDANPSFGKISDQVDGDMHTNLDSALARNLTDSVVRSRTCLRGYSWVTVVPGELVARLGGAPVLQASAAVHQVHLLPGGGAVLQATPKLGGYDDAAMHRLFRLLTPILPPGKPKRSPFEGPLSVVDQDAGEVH